MGAKRKASTLLQDSQCETAEPHSKPSEGKGKCAGQANRRISSAVEADCRKKSESFAVPGYDALAFENVSGDSRLSAKKQKKKHSSITEEVVDTNVASACVTGGDNSSTKKMKKKKQSKHGEVHSSAPDSPEIKTPGKVRDMAAEVSNQRSDGAVSGVDLPLVDPIKYSKGQKIKRVKVASISKDGCDCDPKGSPSKGPLEPTKKGQKGASGIDTNGEAATTKGKKSAKRPKKKLSKKSAEEKPGVSARDAALSYLDTWKTNRSSWSFQKVRQVWLLQHMYSLSDVDDERFAVLLEYLEPLKGKARAETVLKAEELLAKADETVPKAEAVDESAGDDITQATKSPAAAIDELSLQRAKEIVQLLSTE